MKRNAICSLGVGQGSAKQRAFSANGRCRHFYTIAMRSLANARNGLLRSMSGFGSRRPDCQVRFAVCPFANAAWR
jgi:hypothetical protein